LDKPAVVVEPMPEPKSPLTGGASALMAALREAKARAMAAMPQPAVQGGGVE